MTREEIIERSKKIFELHNSGMTFKALSNIYGVTPARIKQIYDKQKWMNYHGRNGNEVLFTCKHLKKELPL